MIQYLLSLFFASMLNQYFPGQYRFEGAIQGSLPTPCVTPSASYTVQLTVALDEQQTFSVRENEYPGTLYLSGQRHDYSLRVRHLLLIKGTTYISRSLSISYEQGLPVVSGYLLGHNREGRIVCANTFVMPGVKK